MLIISNAVCNRCGKTINSPMTTFIQTKISYGSKYDGANITMALCPDCIDKLIQNEFANYKVSVFDSEE